MEANISVCEPGSWACVCPSRLYKKNITRLSSLEPSNGHDAFTSGDGVQDLVLLLIRMSVWQRTIVKDVDLCDTTFTSLNMVT